MYSGFGLLWFGRFHLVAVVGLGFESGGVFVDIIHTRAFADVLERTREEYAVQCWHCAECVFHRCDVVGQAVNTNPDADVHASCRRRGRKSSQICCIQPRWQMRQLQKVGAWGIYVGEQRGGGGGGE